MSNLPSLNVISQVTDIVEIEKQEEMFEIQKHILLQKALTSGNVNEIYQARQYLRKIESRKPSQQQTSKALLVDPLDMSSTLGYKDKYFATSYEILRAMAKSHIPKACIETRKDQVKAHCIPQENKYQPGFVVRKKLKGVYYDKKKQQMTTKDYKIAEWITEFILECGKGENKWHGDDFETFAGKVVEDALSLDQGTWENVRDFSGELTEFMATDGATFRIADTFDDDMVGANTNNPMNRKPVNGYYPSFIQIINGQIFNQFYPWELAFMIRNPKTNIKINGYGYAELEDMISMVTALLNTDAYNANFFKVGSAPKGILRVHGQVNQTKIDEFRNEWVAQVTGVMNMHKIPVMHAEKAEFVDLTKTNRDMEFSKYHEFLIKLNCMAFKIDSSEIGFHLSGAAGAKPLFEGSGEERLKWSRDKGLRPLLRNFQKYLNKYVVDYLHPDFELVFVGLDENNEQQQLDYDIKAVTNIETLDEVRARRDLPPLPNEMGAIPLNPIVMQMKNMSAMGNQQSNQAVDNMQNGGDQRDEGDGQNDQYSQYLKNDEPGYDSNPFEKSIQSEIMKLFVNEPKIILS